MNLILEILGYLCRRNATDCATVADLVINKFQILNSKILNLSRFFFIGINCKLQFPMTEIEIQFKTLRMNIGI